MRANRIQHEGFVDPTFRRKLLSIDRRFQVLWNKYTRRYVFYYQHPTRTSLGPTQFWHNPMHWFVGEKNLDRQELCRAALNFDLQWRSLGWQPLMACEPERRPLDERDLLALVAGDGGGRPGVSELIARVNHEAQRVSKTSIGDRLDTDLFKATLIAQDSPYKNLIDLDRKAKVYRDEARSDRGDAPVPFTTPAESAP